MGQYRVKKMKYEFKAHPLMIFGLLRPFWFFLVIPVVKVVLQFLITGKFGSLLFWECIALIALILIGIFRFKMYSVEVEGEKITVKQGFLLKRSATARISQLSSVEESRNPFDRIFGAVTYEINTEAGLIRKSDFKFKLSAHDGKRLSSLLYGGANNVTVKFSALKLAVMAATTSSVITGIIVSVPVIKKTGDLLGIAIGEMLFDQISDTAHKIQLYFPPIVNIITIVFIAAYFIAFCYSLLKYIKFRLGVDDEKVAVSAGFFVRKRTYFKKNAVNDIKIEQTPLMRLFRLYSLSASVAGFGDSRKETAAVVPCGKKAKIEEYACSFFPFSRIRAEGIAPKHSPVTRSRFLFKPLIFSGIIIGIAVAMVVIFAYFDRLMLFFMFVGLVVVLYYADLCVYNYNNSCLSIGEKSVMAKGIKGLGTREIRCPKEKVGEIKLIRYPADLKHNTCKAKITVRSEGADRLRILHLDYNDAKKEIFDGFRSE